MPERYIPSHNHINTARGEVLPSLFLPKIQRVNPISQQVSDSAGRFLSKIDMQLDQVNNLQHRWNSVLGIQTNEEKADNHGKRDVVQYNPVLARWNWERTSTQEEQAKFKEAEIFNIKTALRERNNAERSDLRLHFDKQGKIRNEAYLKEPWEDVLVRGVEYCKKEYPVESTRVEAEREGFLKLQEAFAKPDAKNGTIAFIISPPGLTEGSIFDHNFVDGYQLQIDEKTGERRTVPYTRFSSPLGYDRYRAIAKEIDPRYFDKKKEQEQLLGEEVPEDVWYLSNPFFLEGYESIETVFEKHFEKDVKAMENKEFEELWQIYLPYVLYYIGQLTKPDFDPVAIAKAWNTIHHSVENRELKEKNKETTIFIAPEVTTLDPLMHQRIAGVVDAFGTQQVEERKVGCGSSGGFSVGEKGSPFANSVANFGVQGGAGEHKWFVCSECGWHADGPIGDNSCGGCGFSKADYAEKYGIICD